MRNGAPIVTIDLEEWFHLLEYALPSVDAWDTLESRVEANTERILELLELHHVRATFFSLGWIAGKYGHLLRRIAAAGHHVGCHSDVHSLVHQQTPAQFREETRRALETISAAVSAPVDCYRAPGFSITESCPWAFEILLELGVRTDCSVFPGRHAHGGTGARFPAVPFRLALPNGQLDEFPMAVTSGALLRVPFAGGGYFRLFPSALIERWASAAPYVMTYFHPRDFDPGQPRLAGLSRLRRFKTYVGLAGSLAKLDRFLGRFGGRSVAEARAQLDWSAAPLVRLPA